jgi:hypothetical protein
LIYGEGVSDVRRHDIQHNDIHCNDTQLINKNATFSITIKM